MIIFSGSDYAKKVIEEGSNYLVYGDPDIDGMIAAYLVCAYLRKRGITFDYYINPNRKHGFTLPIDRLRGKTIIAVDFAMSEQEIQDVVDADNDIVLIDHHHTDSKSLIKYENGKRRGIVINNQYLFEDKAYCFLSGAGVVYYVLGYIDSSMFSEDNKALVGITLLSDIREIENEYAHEILKTTYTANTPMINRLINITKPEYSFSFGAIRMDRQYIDFTFSPRFNALFRANKGFEAFEYMLGKPLDRRFIEECKSFQNKMVDYIICNLKGVEYSDLICKYIEHRDMVDIIKELNLNPMFSDALLSNYIGLVASRIKGKKSSMVYIKNGDDIERGSFRGSGDHDYLHLFRDLGGVADGHKNAFGFHCMLSTSFEEFNEILHGMSQFEDDIETRIIEAGNLSTIIHTQNADIASLNVFRRPSKQVYIKYIGSRSNCSSDVHGKIVEWKIDGVVVKSFDSDLTPWNSFILPFKDKGYTVFYLRKEIN